MADDLSSTPRPSMAAAESMNTPVTLPSADQVTARRPNATPLRNARRIAGPGLRIANQATAEKVNIVSVFMGRQVFEGNLAVHQSGDVSSTTDCSSKFALMCESARATYSSFSPTGAK